MNDLERVPDGTDSVAVGTRKFAESIQAKLGLKAVEKLRDTLLPKLMSGEVRVDCEQ